MAESFLSNQQSISGLPKRFSGFATPLFGDYIMVWQYNSNKLIGCTILHKNNAVNLAKKLLDAVTSYDYLLASQQVTAKLEESADDESIEPG
jgi:hypothetical protein